MKSKVLALAGVAFLAPACATYMSTVNGVTTIKFGAEAQYENLKVLNERVNTARKSLLERFGTDPAAEAATIENVSKELAAVRTELTPMKSNGAPYKSVDENLTDAQDWNDTTRRGLEAQAILRELEGRVLADPGLTAQELDAAEAKVKAFSTNVRKEWHDVATNDTRRMKELRTTTAAGPELREKARAEAEKKAKQKDRELAREQAQTALHEARQIEAKVRHALEKAEVPSEDDVNALAAAVAKIGESSSDEARRNQKLLLDARITRALELEAAGPALQGLFQGAVATSGQSKGKSLSVTLSVKKNHCVAWFGRFASYTGSEKMLEMTVSFASDGSAAQQFGYWPFKHNDSSGFELHGLCATRDVKATIGAKLEFTGTKNGVRYAALDFERPGFSKTLAPHLVIHMPDHCDPEAWAAMWLNPIPGTLGYLRGEPVVLSQDRAHFAGGPGENDSFRDDDFSRAPPKAVKFTHQFKWARCNLEGESATSKALKACDGKIEKRYDAQWKSVERTRDVADGMSTSTWKYYSPAAEEKASRLKLAADKDWERECQPTEDKAEKAFARRFEKLVDQLTDNRPVDVLFGSTAEK